MAIVQLPDVRLNYLKIDGDAPARSDEAVIFIHGMASSLAFWNLNVTQTIAERHKVLLVDLRGHGRSSIPEAGYRPSVMAEDLLGLMDSVSIEKAHVVAHSFGGAVGLHLAYRAPERVSTLTLADTRLRGIQPKIDFKNWIVWTEYRDCLQDAGIEDWESAGELGAAMFTRMAKVRLERPDQFEKINKVMPSPFVGIGGSAAAKRWLNLVERTNFLREYEDREDLSEEMLSRIMTPTLLLYGEFSQSLPTARTLSALLPDSRFRLVDAAGHFFPATRPDFLIEAFSAFLEETNMRRPAAIH